ncbi:AbrB/MazE/SpoVT family DNA-binding domain-containing protein [Candidatus Gottesmanbacteria bacterium]|nr:AbrB/MazE/SpoVT family DNA-binding domain-containing protein [Candidatus Gottesmanbacteria bacterium]
MATLSSKGQVTIPREIRDFMLLEKMDKLIFTALGKDLLLVKPVKKDFLAFGGSVTPKRRPENFDKVREEVLKKIGQSISKKT